MQKVLETIESGVVAVGAARAITLFNRAAEQLTGTSAQVGARPVARVPAQPARQRAPGHRCRWRAAVPDRVLAARRGRPDGAAHVLDVAAARAGRGAAGCGRGARRHVAAQGAGAGEAAGGAPGLDRGDRRRGWSTRSATPSSAIKTFAQLLPTRGATGVPRDVLPDGGPGDRTHRRSAEPLPHDVARLPATHGDRWMSRTPSATPWRLLHAAARGAPDPAPAGRRAARDGRCSATPLSCSSFS